MDSPPSVHPASHFCPNWPAEPSATKPGKKWYAAASVPTGASCKTFGLLYLQSLFVKVKPRSQSGFESSKKTDGLKYHVLFSLALLFRALFLVISSTQCKGHE